MTKFIKTGTLLSLIFCGSFISCIVICVCVCALELSFRSKFGCWLSRSLPEAASLEEGAPGVNLTGDPFIRLTVELLLEAVEDCDCEEEEDVFGIGVEFAALLAAVVFIILSISISKNTPGIARRVGNSGRGVVVGDETAL